MLHAPTLNSLTYIYAKIQDTFFLRSLGSHPTNSQLSEQLYEQLLRLLFRNWNAAPSKYDSLADLFKNLVADVLDEDAISHVDEDAALGARLRSYFRTIVILLEEATADR